MIARKFLKDWQNEMNRFIWDSKKPGVKLKAVQLRISQGGLAIPNINFYYDAARLAWILKWIKT